MYNVIMHEVIIPLGALPPTSRIKILQVELNEWIRLYGIPAKLTTRISEVGYKSVDAVVTLALEKDLTWFLLTWTGTKQGEVRMNIQ